MSRPTPWQKMVRAAKSEALLAVKLYNEPLLERSLEGFVVHMHLAWLYLLHAEFTRDGQDLRYPDEKYAGRYQKIDGEYRTWDLAKCARTRWNDPNDPVRANLEFFIQFRNKTEHRHKGSDASWFAAIADKSQAVLMNFEEELTSKFGAENSLASQLRFPIFIGTFTEPANEAMLRFQRSLPADLKKFLADYDAGLAKTTQEDSRYSFRLKVQLQTSLGANPDLAIQFVRSDDLTHEQAAKLDDLGKTGTVIIKERGIPVSNKDLFKPGAVRQEVAKAIPFRFNTRDLELAWRIGGVRPPGGAAHPERTKSEFCRYDGLNKNYGYTQAYIDYLIKNCSTPEGFKKVTGRDPVPLVQDSKSNESVDSTNP